MKTIQKILLVMLSVFVLTYNDARSLPKLALKSDRSGPCPAVLNLGTQDFAKAIALQTDGNIVAAGFSVVNKVQKILVARYSGIDGSLDCNFGSIGAVTSSPGSQQSANAVAIQTDGKIVVAGEIFINNKNQFIIARYNSDGSPDSSFGAAGIVVTPIGDGAAANAIGIQTDGNIVVAGSAVINGQADIVVARYSKINGNLDGSFGQAGIAIVPLGKRARANALKIQSNGNILVGGSAAAPNESFALVRLTPTGALDSSFGLSGVVTDSIGGTNVIRALALDAANNIVISGFIDEDFAVARYTPSGSRDSSFGSNGFAISMIGSDSESNGVAVQLDNKIVAVGFSDVTGMIYARYNPDGTPDTSFGLSGTGILTIVEVGNAAAKAVILQPDGKIVGAGFSCNDVAIDRLNPDGTPDAGFGLNGIVHNPKGSFCPTQHGASGPVVKDKILIRTKK